MHRALSSFLGTGGTWEEWRNNHLQILLFFLRSFIPNILMQAWCIVCLWSFWAQQVLWHLPTRGAQDSSPCVKFSFEIKRCNLRVVYNWTAVESAPQIDSESGGELCRSIRSVTTEKCGSKCVQNKQTISSTGFVLHCVHKRKDVSPWVATCSVHGRVFVRRVVYA